MLNIWRLTLTSFRREIRAHEWLIIFLALILAVATITSLHFYTGRIKRALLSQNAILIGGDLALVSPNPIDPAIEKKAKENGLKTATLLSFPTMASANNKMQLVTVQAASDTYPIVGFSSLPKPNSVYTEARTLQALQIKLGATVKIGSAYFHVDQELKHDLNNLQTGFLIAPRLLMRLSDIPQTHTVLSGSRVEYRLLLAGEAPAIKTFQQFLSLHLKSNQRILSAQNAQAFLTDAMSNFENYLNLILGVSLLMAGTAILISATEYLRRHRVYAALWRSLGASRKQLVFVMMIQLMMIALIAICIGCVLGFLLQLGLEYLFRDTIPFDIPPANFSPVGIGFIISFVLLFACTFPLIYVLPRTSPLMIWREEENITTYNPLTLSLLIIALVLFLFFFLNHSLFSLFLIDMCLICIAILYAISILYIKLIRYAADHSNSIWRRGFRQLVQYQNMVSLQFIGFSLIISLLIVVSSIKTAMLYDWQERLPANTPNFFAFNIAPEDVTAFLSFWQNKHVTIEGIYPMVRGRLVSRNHQPIFEVTPPDARGHNALHRELNLSYMQTLPTDNKIVAGRTFNSQDRGKALVSVEADLAKSLNMKLGDTLTFLVGDQHLTAKIINFRTLQWTSFHPNFFMIFPENALSQFPTTYISSFYLTTSDQAYLNNLLEQMPNITLIDVASLLQQIKKIMATMVFALQFLFMLCLTLAVLIFLASLQASKKDRLYNSKLLRLLGASQKYIRCSLIVEFCTLFLLIMFTALLVGKLCAYFVVNTFFLNG